MSTSSLSRTVHSHRDELCQRVRPYVDKEDRPFVKDIIWAMADELADKLDAEQSHRSQEFVEATQSLREALIDIEHSSGVVVEIVSDLLFMAKKL